MSYERYVAVRCDWRGCEGEFRTRLTSVVEAGNWARQKGWAFSMGKHFCPTHAKERLKSLS